MKHISVMIKPASAECNLRCSYCFYRDVSESREVQSHGTMSETTANLVIQNTLADLDAGDVLSVCFQGGEPTLAGLHFFKRFASTATRLADTKGVKIAWSLQTNGLLLDFAWCEFLLEYRFLVGLSIDFHLHDVNRLDTGGRGTLRRVLEAKALLEQFHVPYNILCVVTGELARCPARVWKELKQHGGRYVQFIPCLGSLNGQHSRFALTPERYAFFYNGIIPLWADSLRKGQYISVKLLDDIINLLAGHGVNGCGLTGACTPQFVVEADGSVYPCDFYVLDEYRLGSLTTQGLRELYEGEPMKMFLQRNPPATKVCAECTYHRICGGGCPRMQPCMVDQNYCGHKSVLTKNIELFSQLACEQQKFRRQA